MLGQGSSDKPVLDSDFDDNARMLADIMDSLGIEQAYVAGISYGGVVALKFPLLFPEKSKGMIPISCFSEIDGQLFCHSLNLHKALSQVGFEYYVDYLMPLNFTSHWIEEHSNILDFSKRVAVAGMEVYGIQNIMEKLADLPSYTEELANVQCPTLIMNGEFDWLTPRHLHEIIRKQIKNSQLVLIPKVAHAMTIEIPDLCCQVIANFVEEVESGTWQGDQSVWIANEELGAYPVKFPCVGDHLRMIPIEQTMQAYQTSREQKKDQYEAQQKSALKRPLTKTSIPEPDYPKKGQATELNLAASKMKSVVEKRKAKAETKRGASAESGSNVQPAEKKQIASAEASTKVPKKPTRVSKPAESTGAKKRSIGKVSPPKNKK
jgi:pimeloyl-ACP methyl ester carboxylesterase